MSSEGPSSSLAASQPEATEPPKYRSAKQLHPDLREHCTIYFEHELYLQAVSLLSNFLVAGNSAPLNDQQAAYVPPPYILSLIATLTVHPSLTTRTTSDEKQAAANQALHYLHLVNKLVGPTNANFSKSFNFTDQERLHSSRKPNRHQLRDEEQSEDSDDERKLVEEVDTKIAKENSLWARADNFWSVLGWAFNCSVKWKGRWERWKHWLEFMLDVLEDDWAEKRRLAKDLEASPPSRDEPLKDSLIFQYLMETGTQSRGSRRKIMRAILAAGSPKSLAEFREVFKNETKEMKRIDDEAVTKKSKLDIQEGNFGDYNDDADEDEDEEEGYAPRTSRRSRGTTTPGGDEDVEDGLYSDMPSTSGIDAYGGMESLLLRRRTMILLARVAEALPNDFTSIEDVYDIYTEFLRPLPLPVFSFFVNPSLEKGAFPMSIHASLNKVLLRPLLSTTKRHEDAWVRQDILEEYYLPFVANMNSVVDNAKVAILLCSLMRMLKMFGELNMTPSLKEAVETGCEARRTKVEVVIDSKKRKGAWSAEDAEERRWWSSYEEMLKMIVSMVDC